jgi:hypothetical protein
METIGKSSTLSSGPLHPSLGKGLLSFPATITPERPADSPAHRTIAVKHHEDQHQKQQIQSTGSHRQEKLPAANPD